MYIILCILYYIMYMHIYIWFIIRDNVPYEGFSVLDYLLQKNTDI